MNLAVVPSGSPLKFSIESSAFGSSPTLTVWSLAFGSFLSASVGFSGVAGFLVTNSDNGFVSVEPSVYVTTRFPLSSFLTDWILPFLSTGVSFAIFASSFFLLYSSFSFSLILSKSSFVTLVGSATSTLSAGAGVAISYLSVWDLTIKWTYPGVWVAFGFLSNALKSVFDGALSLSLATTKLVQWFGALSVVTPVILIVAVAPDTVPSPWVTAEFSIFPVVKP